MDFGYRYRYMYLIKMYVDTNAVLKILFIGTLSDSFFSITFYNLFKCRLFLVDVGLINLEQM